VEVSTGMWVSASLPLLSGGGEDEEDVVVELGGAGGLEPAGARHGLCIGGAGLVVDLAVGADVVRAVEDGAEVVAELVGVIDREPALAMKGADGTHLLIRVVRSAIRQTWLSSSGTRQERPVVRVGPKILPDDRGWQSRAPLPERVYPS
jgi:hypothetical protein